LLTPSCIQKLNQKKLCEHKRQETEKEKHYSLRRKKEDEIVVKQVSSYIGKLTAKQISSLEKEFSVSIYARGLKFGNAEIDFSNRLVTAAFRRYVFRKHLTR